MSTITLEQANMIVAAAFAEGAARSLKPLTVAVLDPGSHLIALARADGASTLRPQIAIAKAGGALALGMSSRKIGDMATERPTFIASLGPISPLGIVPAAGGVIVVNADGLTIGAVGITGDTSDNDEACVLAALTAARLLPQD